MIPIKLTRSAQPIRLNLLRVYTACFQDARRTHVGVAVTPERPAERRLPMSPAQPTPPPLPKSSGLLERGLTRLYHDWLDPQRPKKARPAPPPQPSQPAT